jgi:hypothetical protein
VSPVRSDSPNLKRNPDLRRTTLFYILIFGLLAVVLVVAFAKKWSARNDWPDDE